VGNVLGGIKARINSFLEALLWGAIAAAAAMTGILFLLAALFIWLAARYDAVTACVVLGLTFVAAALGATIAFLLVRRQPARPPTPAAAPVDPLAQAGRNLDVLSDLLAEASDQGRHTADVVRKAADNVADAFQETLERRPLAALGIVLGVGFLFGAKWRR
jgi:hypothetical protein